MIAVQPRFDSTIRQQWAAKMQTETGVVGVNATAVSDTTDAALAYDAALLLGQVLVTLITL